MVDKPVPKEGPRVATNLLLRAALLLSPNREVAEHFTTIVTSGRKRGRIVSDADENAITRELVTALDQGITHGNWQS